MGDIRFIFCGLDSYGDLSLLVNEINQPIGPAITENSQTVPGMYGNIFQGNSYGSKQFDILCTIIASSEEDRVEKMHYLSEVMVQTGTGEFPMVFTNNPDYTYYGHFTSLPAPTRVSQTDSAATVTLSFVCSDPLAYGELKTVLMTGSPATYTPDGTGQARPIFTCFPTSDLTKIAVTDINGNYAYIGSDINPDTQDTVIDNFPVIINDECRTFETGWSVIPETSSFSIENAVINPDAVIEPWSNQGPANKFAIKDNKEFGSPVDGKFYGAGVQYYFPATYSDFKVRARLFNNQKYPRAKGKIEVYLLNSNGQRIGRMGIRDGGLGNDAMAIAGIGNQDNEHLMIATQGTVRADRSRSIQLRTKSGTKTVTSSGKKKTITTYRNFSVLEDLTSSTYTDFYGYLSIQKIGNLFTAEVIKLNESGNPVWTSPVSVNFTDQNNTYTDDIAGVALYIGKHQIVEDVTDPVINYENNHMGLLQIQVWNILNGGENANSVPEIIARRGDEVKINCEDGRVYKNGIPFMDKFYIGSNFPKLQGGVPNTLALDPPPGQGAEWYLDYRPVLK